MNPTHTITTKHFPTLVYRRYGQGPALMLLHGFPASGKLWDGIYFQLSQQFTVLIPDIPGSGNSRLEGEVVTMEQLATIVPAILDHAEIDTCVLAGHSMGGYVSIAAAELYPERLSGLFFVHSTALADDEAKKEKRAKSIALIRKGGQEEFVRGMIPTLFEENYRNEHPDIIESLKQEGLKLPAESMIAFYTAMMNRPDRTEVLRNAAFPVGWALGDHDTTIPWQTALQQSMLPSVNFIELYDHCGHMSMLERPEALSRQLLEFSAYCARRAKAHL
jgi:pimeloyl-ACP methyl ester carboxylesterase